MTDYIDFETLHMDELMNSTFTVQQPRRLDLAYPFKANKNVYRGLIVPGEVGCSGSGYYLGFETYRIWFYLFGRAWGLRAIYWRKNHTKKWKVPVINAIHKVWNVKYAFMSCEDGSFNESYDWYGKYPEEIVLPGTMLHIWVETLGGVYIGNIAQAHWLLSHGIYHVEPFNQYISQLHDKSWIKDDELSDKNSIFNHSKTGVIGFDGKQWWCLTHRATFPVPIGSTVGEKEDGDFSVCLKPSHEDYSVEVSGVSWTDEAIQEYENAEPEFMEWLQVEPGFHVKNLSDSQRVAWLSAYHVA